MIDAPTLAARAQGRDNNLNLVRVAAALAVLLTHSFALALGSPAAEPLRAALGMSLGDIAVDVFFVASGFLVANSLLTNQDATGFVCARLLRIFPALLVMLALTVFGLGLALTTMSAAEYLTSRETWRYLLRGATLIAGVSYTLPGVFEHNPYPAAVNGSLWTLPHEVRMYALLLGAWLLVRVIARSAPERPFKRLLVAATCCAGVALLALDIAGRPEGHFLHLFYMFFGGASARILANRIVLRTHYAALAASVLLVCALHPVLFRATYYLVLPYLVLYLAYVPAGAVRYYNRLGDYSYGIYIFAFPVQQALLALVPRLSVAGLAAASAVLTLLLAVPSWVLLERPALNLKARLARRSRQLWARAIGAA